MVPLPAPHPPAVLDRAALAEAAAPARQAAEQAARRVLAAADIDPASLTAVLLVGGGAGLPGLADALHAGTALPPVVPARPDLAAAHGALAATGPAATPAADPAPVYRVVRPRLPALVAPVLLGPASLAVFAQAVTIAAPMRGDRGQLDALAPVQQLAAAAVLALLAGVAVAHLLTATWLHTQPPGQPAAAGFARAARTSYLPAAATGLAVAGLYGLFAATYLDRVLDNPYLTWTLGWTLPIAALTALSALLTARLPAVALPGWVDRNRPPLYPALAAAAGMLLALPGMWAGRGLPVDVGEAATGLGHAGAALLGIATAATVTRRRILRIVTAVLLAAGYATVYGAGTHRYLALAYLAALLWWAALAAGHTARAAIPPQLIQGGRGLRE
jgi:hypothetical protein